MTEPETATPRTPILLRRCEACSTHYEHADGGTCISCGNQYCGRHLYGGGPFWRLSRKVRRPICVSCRRGRHQPTAG
ncbi:MAG: hypothetical protein AB7I33_09750 [Gemmatimonadales bacterium]